MSAEAELAVLLAAIKKIDKQVAWRRKRRAEDQADIDRLDEQRTSLCERHAELFRAEQGWGPATDNDDPWT